MIGSTLHGYRIIRLIGTGGMADLYYAENSLGFPAAIKVLKKEYTNQTQVQERFVNEARIMKSLKHDYIRKVMDVGTIDGQAAIIMEYLDGQTLKEMIQSGKKIPDSALKKYFDQCTQALIYTHSRNIIHRDIKPSNIFITSDDEVKLLDFGIAKSEVGITQTITSQTLGTIIYMSPEQVVDPKRVTGKTDIYSLGITFYHALTGKAPYDATTGSEFIIQQKIVYEDLDLSLLPSHWKSLLEGFLLKKPEERTYLQANNSDGDTIVDNPKPKPPPKILKPDPKPINYKPWLIGAVLCLVLLFGGIWLVNYFQHKDEDTTEEATEVVGTTTAVADTTSSLAEENNTKIKTVNDETLKAKDDLIKKEERDWHETKRINSINSYTNYLDSYPSGRYVIDARQKKASLEEAERRQAEQTNTAPKKPYIKMISIPGRNFSLSETEVTIGQYLAFCKATNSHWPVWLEKGSQYNIYTGSNGFYKSIGMTESNTNHPITGVSAINADAFCAWMGSRLPTESEWEYAAIGGENYEYSGSNDLNEVGWYSDNSGGKTRPVRQLSPNAYGLYDMSGNVWEWTSSKVGADRVNRGGCWVFSAEYCRVSIRGCETPSKRDIGIGFRLAH